MTDEQIIQLYKLRSEQAIVETTAKYGTYCRTIAYGILKNNEDSEECLSDTCLKAWESIPPHKPNPLSTFLGRITRNLALNKLKHASAQKRGGCEYQPALEELSDCIPDSCSPEQVFEAHELARLLNAFLAKQTPQARKVFMQRYWYLNSVKEIADHFGFTESKVKMILLRSRNQLKKVLEKEGISL